MKHWLLVWVLMLNFGAAQAQAAAPSRLALLIGNWDYNANGKFDKEAEGEFQPDLEHPCEDVSKLEAALHKVRFGDVEVACNLPKVAFDKRIADFSRRVAALPKGSLVFIYYSGHGAQQFGYLFSLPVLFRMPLATAKAKLNDQVRYLSSSAVDVQAMLEKFPERKDLAIYIALDQCRSAAFAKKDAVNDMVNIHTRENVMIQYSTTPDQTSPDSKGFSSLLVQELVKGGNISDMASRVTGISLDSYVAEKTTTYANLHAGQYFSFFRSPALFLKAAPGESVERPVVQDKGEVLRNRRFFRKTADNPKLGIFWCEGNGERERYAVAVDLAEKVAKDAQHYGVGIVSVQPLSVEKNLHDNYNVWRNLMRFDRTDPNERAILERISAQFSDLALLPQRGVGHHGEPTKKYVSVFICDGFVGR